ncbi:MAG: hypothetical protein P8Y52_12155, partial [Xanthomonadales bacterium]
MSFNRANIGHHVDSIFFAGDIAELIFFDTALSECDRSRVESYLANKYGLYTVSDPTAICGVICDGFDPPMAEFPVKTKKNRALPLKAQLYDDYGYPLSDLDLTAPPVVQVLFSSATGNDEPVDVTDDILSVGQGYEGNQFIFTEDGKWQFNLKT